MRIIKTFSILLVMIVPLVIFQGCDGTDTTNQKYTQTIEFTDTSDNKINMEITSAAFQPNSTIPSKYTCDGDNINPPLSFKDVPEGAKSLALIMDDPDAPSGTWVHWTVWNLSPDTKEIGENSVPEGAIEGTTSSGNTGYGGPCPPSGSHRYFFKLYALDIELALTPNADKFLLEEAMQGHILAKAELIGNYSRN